MRPLRWDHCAFGVACGCAVVYAAAFVVPIRRQYLAVQAVEQCGATYQRAGAGPLWLRDLLGDGSKGLDTFAQVTLSPHAGEEAFRGLPWIKGLIGVTVLDGELTDAKLSSLAAIPALESLDLSGSRIAAGALTHLRRTKSMRELYLADASISDADMPAIAELTGLTVLDLSGTRITDAGLRGIGVLTRLTFLDLSSTRISDRCCAEIARLPQLVHLTLDRTEIGDAGLLDLGDLRTLRDLSVTETAVTDGGATALLRALACAGVMLHRQGTSATGYGGPGTGTAAWPEPNFEPHSQFFLSRAFPFRRLEAEWARRRRSTAMSP